MSTSSFWYEDVGIEKRPRLTADTSCDLLVIGSGIAGLSAAYEAARWGWKVVVIDRQETIGGVMTPRTTAHLASELDDYYHYLVLQPLGPNEDLLIVGGETTAPAKRPTWRSAPTT